MAQKETKVGESELFIHIHSLFNKLFFVRHLSVYIVLLLLGAHALTLRVVPSQLHSLHLDVVHELRQALVSDRFDGKHWSQLTWS